ncbi:hypothetical protein [Barnesiella viscericola]|uniref:hypothetical protein n=1 Tax=Barnesiella viscericola TaxID=397865 RepID=UPI001E29EF7E|nr:hypothetical protein [Barnesiella viscericola]
MEQNNSSLFCQATNLNSERVRGKPSNGFLLALFVCLLRKIYHNIFTSPNGEENHYLVGKAAMPLKTLPVCNRRRGNKIIQTASLHAVHIKDRLCHRKKPAFNHVKTMTLHTLCGIHAGKGNEQETIIGYKTSKLYKQNEKVILFIQLSYGNSNRIKFV